VPAEAFILDGKDCPENDDPSSCLAENRLHSSFAEAWQACSTTSDCGFIMKFSDGKYYLRRASDPDNNVQSAGMMYTCQAPPNTNQARTCSVPAEAFILDGKDCPENDDPSSCLAENRLHSSFAEAWQACSTTSDCGFIMKYSDGKYYLRRASDPDRNLPSAGMMYTCQVLTPEPTLVPIPAPTPRPTPAPTPAPESSSTPTTAAPNTPATPWWVLAGIIVGVAGSLACIVLAVRQSEHKGDKGKVGMQDERHFRAEEGNLESPQSPMGSRRAATPSGMGLETPKSADDTSAGAYAPSQHRHTVVPPSRWGVTLDQLDALLREVEKRYPDVDPTVYTVVNEIIKPMTEKAGCSYALMLNPNGVDAENFVTHAWGEGFKAFVGDLRKANVSGGFWICFLANPQTWEPSELKALLGVNPFMSPFHAALTEASKVVAVRNSNLNMYTRLWCVFELWAANEKNKEVIVVGPNPESIDPGRTGYNATCFDERDTQMLRQAIDARGKKKRVNMYVGSVMFADSAAEPDPEPVAAPAAAPVESEVPL